MGQANGPGEQGRENEAVIMKNTWTRILAGTLSLTALLSMMGFGAIKLFGVATEEYVDKRIEAVEEGLKIDFDILIGLHICQFQDLEPFSCPAFEKALSRAR